MVLWYLWNYLSPSHRMGAGNLYIAQPATDNILEIMLRLMQFLLIWKKMSNAATDKDLFQIS